uniref:Candidate secreted effector n=1 Tax=Meloidogyne incognita TaxID=6306 RepID=A0A914LUH9_MELIC
MKIVNWVPMIDCCALSRSFIRENCKWVSLDSVPGFLLSCFLKILCRLCIVRSHVSC